MIPEGEPTDLQKDATRLLASAHRMRWAAVAGVIAALGIGIMFLAVVGFQQHQQIKTLQVLLAKQSRQLDASCNFYQDLGTVPLPIQVPRSGRPSELGVRLIIHSRAAFDGQGCAGQLPPPSPGLVKWATVYRLFSPIPR